MSSESDRVARAGDYVFGLMNDRERARAERDLEIDAAFRDTVLRLAERLRALDPAAPAPEGHGNRWEVVTQRLAALPQMQTRLPSSEPKRSRSVRRSSSPCVGCSCVPSPALMTFDSIRSARNCAAPDEP